MSRKERLIYVHFNNDRMSVIMIFTSKSIQRWNVLCIKIANQSGFSLGYNYTMRFIGYDSIQTRWFIYYRFQIRTIT